jgi:hypothetical protein
MQDLLCPFAAQLLECRTLKPPEHAPTASVSAVRTEQGNHIIPSVFCQRMHLNY